MRRLIAVAVTCWICSFAAMAHGQQIDVAFAGGSLNSNGNSFSGASFLPAEGGGAFVGFNGEVLFRPFFKGNLGVQAEVGGQIPYSKYFGTKALGGIGGENIRFYSNSYNNCNFYGNCTNYVSRNHFMGDLGGGIRFYPYGNFFVRPEMRLYLINNNEEFRFEPSSSLWCLDWLRSRREQIRSGMPRCTLTRWQWESSVLR